MKKILILILSAALLCSCSKGPAPVYTPKDPMILLEPEQPADGSTPVFAPVGLPKTNAPVINDCLNTEPDLISIGGKCERDAVITLKTPENTVQISAVGEYFLAQVRIPKSGSCDIEITATSPGKIESDVVTRRVKYTQDAYVQQGDWHILINGESRGFAQSTFRDFEGTNLLTQRQLTRFGQRIESQVEQLDREVPGCELIYMIVPNPLTVYADKAPEGLVKSEGQTRLDQVLEAIESAGATALDLRPAMQLHRDDDMPIYHNTDSHWTEYGAYIGLCELCNHISKRFPKAAARPVEDYGFETRLAMGGDVIYYLGMDEKLEKQEAPFFDPVFKLPVTAEKYLPGSLRMDFNATSSRIQISTGQKELPNCVVFRDSYSVALYEILPERFNNTAYYYTWGYTFDMDYIKKAHPDYVIYLLAERDIGDIVK